MAIQVSTPYYHGHLDTEARFTLATEDNTTTKHVIIQERELSYAIAPHFHPYAGALTRDLLQRGVPGVQAADTAYVPGASLPASVRLAVAAGAPVTVAAQARIALAKATQATFPDGTTIDLSAHTQVALAAPGTAAAPDGMTVTLLAGLSDTPPPGSDYPQAAEAYLPVATPIRLTNTTTIVLAGGARANLAAASDVVLQPDARLSVPATSKKTLQSSRPRPVRYEDVFSATSYDPSALVRFPYPVKDLDFGYSGAYSIYNWELFFHVPFTMAVHLSKNGRFAEAQRWFHYLFDPTDDSDGPTPERFWKVRPFQQTDVRKVEEMLVNLATGADPELRRETLRSIEAWKDAPFRPHVIARYRQQAYMYKTVMAYLDNLIAWGDSLFRQDTGEAIDEALMLYVLAAGILGPRPQPVPTKRRVRPQTYHNLRADLVQFGTALRDVEPELGFDLMPFPGDQRVDTDRLGTVRSLGKALYFGIPANAQLLRYWDLVADRLFKIRNSLNLQGTFRQLALFDPPIDPAMLARAAAAGLDVRAIVSGLNQPLPLVRFSLLLQKAGEICQEVRSLGTNLLSVMEKQDAEALALLRARHERVALGMAEDVKYAQVQEAVKAKEGLLKSLALAIQRYSYYERHLGRTPEEIASAVPTLEDLDKESLGKQKLKAQEPEMAGREIEVDIDRDVFAQAAQALYGGKLMSSHEVRESLFLEGAQLSSDIANILSIASSVAHFVPEFTIHATPFGVGVATHYGGQEVGSAIGKIAGAGRAVAERLNFEAKRAARINEFARREREWAHQSNQAAGEITQIFKQLRAAQLREAVAELELKTHRQHMTHAVEVEHFLNESGTDRSGKSTGKALYAWLRREVKGLHAQCFQLAFDTARKAERALQHELGEPSASFVQTDYLAGTEGLLAGERLALDLKRMELAYHDLDQREYELTKHVSLLDVAPMALVQLRRTGHCTFRLPEAVFDLDGPGHYFRRIRSVAVSVPCVTGPYGSVNCTLSLLKSSIRTSPVLRDGSYPSEGTEDERFSDHFGSIQSVVTSSAQNDTGLFEANPRDERYRPFEHAGAISEWQVELPADPSRNDPLQFDADSISDVILHVRYTAREGGSLLRRGAVDSLKDLMAAGSAPGSVRLFSLRHEFATEWSRFRTDTPPAGERHAITIPLGPQHFPLWSRGRLSSVNSVALLASSDVTPEPATLDVFDKPLKNDPTAKKDVLAAAPGEGDLLAGALAAIPLPVKPDQELTLYLDENALADMWLALTWSG